MSWRQFGAKVSGAVIGDAIGGVPGAFLGWKAGEKLTQQNSNNNMAGKGKGVTDRRIGKKRGKVTANIIKTRIKRPRKRMTSIKPVTNQSAKTVDHKRIRKGRNVKKSKVVKITKSFREKVTKVFDSKEVSGSGRCVLLGCRVDVKPDTPALQAVFPLPLPRANNRQLGLLFDPEFIMYAASRLWNGRLASPRIAGAGSAIIDGAWSNINIQRSDLGTGFISSDNWSNFHTSLFTQASDFKVKVTNLKAKITMKNNSGRTMYLKMYDCRPKIVMEDVVNDSIDGKALSDWNRYCSNFDGAAYSIGQMRGGAGTGVVGLRLSNESPPAINITKDGTTPSVSYKTLYATPMQNENFKKHYSVSEYMITLEAGQIHTHWVQGDEKEYDFSKMGQYVGSDFRFLNVQKSNCYIFFTAVNELAHSATSTGRLNAELESALLFETQIFVSMKMPEKAGTVQVMDGTVVAGQEKLSSVVPLTHRKRGYFVDTYWDNADDINPLVTYTVNRDDNNPTLVKVE